MLYLLLLPVLAQDADLANKVADKFPDSDKPPEQTAREVNGTDFKEWSFTCGQ